MALLLVMSLCGLFQKASAEEMKILVRSNKDSQSVTGLSTGSSSVKAREWKTKVIHYQGPDDLLQKLQDVSTSGSSWEPDQVFQGTLISESVDSNLNQYDPLFAQEWSMYNPFRGSSNNFAGGDIDVVRAWNFLDSQGLPKGKGYFYSIDSGLDVNNPDIANKIIGGYNVYDGSSNPADENGHGTNVASIATASDNGVGISGVAPGSDVYIFGAKVLDKQNQGDTSNVILGLKKALENFLQVKKDNPDAHAVLNASFGSTSYSQALYDALLPWQRSDVLIVAAAGNNGTNNDQSGFYPCAYNIANIVCVASTGREDFLSSFSNYGSKTVDIEAPGEQILGAYLGNLSGSSYTAEWRALSGTSQATPHVSGVALLIWGANPTLGSADVKSILIDSVDRLPGAEQEVLGGGRLNAYRAVLEATANDPNLANRNLDSRRNSKGGGSCSMSPEGSTSGLSFFIILLLLFSSAKLWINTKD